MLMVNVQPQASHLTPGGNVALLLSCHVAAAMQAGTWTGWLCATLPLAGSCFTAPTTLMLIAHACVHA